METPPARRRASRTEPRVDLRDLGEDALAFAKWFRRSKFDLMAGFYGELGRDPSTRDRAALERRFLAALRHAKRVLLARVLVTVLLVMGVVATAAATVARALYVPAALSTEVQLTLLALDRVAAVAGSATVVLVALRLLFDRYLELVGTSATFLAMQLAACPHAR